MVVNPDDKSDEEINTKYKYDEGIREDENKSGG